MKKLYEMPSIELTKFDVEDVITASTQSAADFMGETEVNAVATWKSEWNESWNGSLGI